MESWKLRQRIPFVEKRPSSRYFSAQTQKSPHGNDLKHCFLQNVPHHQVLRSPVQLYIYLPRLLWVAVANSVMNNFMKELRSSEIQQDSMRFRRNIERVGEIMAYEISKTLSYATEAVRTPLGVAPTNVVNDHIVVASIMRAALPLHHGMLNYFDKAENAFISAYREYTDAAHNNFRVHVEYLASPSIEGKTVLLCDPMLATGGSMELAYEALKAKGTPAHIHIASIIASRQAVKHILEIFPADKTTVWIAAIDDELNEHSYIVPGLGDAGDLAFGEKL